MTLTMPQNFPLSNCFHTIPKLIQTMIYFDNHSFVILVLCSLLRRNKSLRISTLSDSYKQQHYIPINYTCLNPKWLTGCADKFFGAANIFNRNRFFFYLRSRSMRKIHYGGEKSRGQRMVNVAVHFLHWQRTDCNVAAHDNDCFKSYRILRI